MTLLPDLPIVSDPDVPTSGTGVAGRYNGRPLRILHVVESFGGGVYEMIRLLTAGLADRGHDVGVAYGVRPETPPDVERTMDKRVNMFAMPWTRRTLPVQAAAFAKLRRLEREWQPDVVHLHSSFAGTVGAAALGGRCPCIYTPHGYAFDALGYRVPKRFFRAVERRVARRVTAVGAVSMSEAALAEGLGTARKVVTVPNGIPEFDARVRRPSDLDHPHRVVAMGRVMAQRQPLVVAAILGGLRDVAEVEWIGGGRDDDPEPQLALADSGVALTGWLPRDEAMRRLDDALVYVHWTAWDGHALSVLEAIARDVVVVANDIPASREILGPEHVFRTPRDARAFIRRILADECFRAETLLSQHRRAHRFGAEAMVDNWLDFYGSLPVETSLTPVYAAAAV